MVNESDNICENIVVWDGNSETWQPPLGYLMLVQATTPTKIWVLTVDNTYVLGDSIGDGDIGWTWDGTYLTTNQPQPSALAPQPITDLPSV